MLKLHPDESEGRMGGVTVLHWNEDAEQIDGQYICLEGPLMWY